MMFYDGFTFINKRHEEDYSFIFIRFFLPIYTFCYLTGILSKYIFHLIKPDSKKERRFGYYFDDRNWACITSIFINAEVELILAFIFFFHDIYFKFILIFFSIFCFIFILGF